MLQTISCAPHSSVLGPLADQTLKYPLATLPFPKNNPKIPFGIKPCVKNTFVLRIHTFAQIVHSFLCKRDVVLAFINPMSTAERTGSSIVLPGVSKACVVNPSHVSFLLNLNRIYVVTYDHNNSHFSQERSQTVSENMEKGRDTNLILK